MHGSCVICNCMCVCVSACVHGSVFLASTLVCASPYSGEPLDLMRRGVLAASTEQLARQMVPHINHIEFPRD